MDTIKETLSARESGRGDSPEVQRMKTILTEAKGKSRMLQQEKRNRSLRAWRRAHRGAGPRE